MLRTIFSASVVSAVVSVGCASVALAGEYSSLKDDTASSWGGAYIGLHAGKQFDGGVTYEDQEASDFDGPGHPMHDEVEGWLGGLHAGYNHQFGNLVVGVEASIDAGNQDAHRLEVPALNYVTDTEVNYMASIAGRAGLAFDRFFFFGKAGVAYIDYDYSASFQQGNLITARSHDFDDFGYVVGGGVEYALTDRFTIGAEYEHYDFGSQTDGIQREAGCCGDDVLKADVDANIIKARLGMRF
jgi:outer membrane immunogenic protein